MSLLGSPQSLVYTGEGNHPISAINFPVGSYLAAGLTSHIICLEGAFFVAIFGVSQST